MKYKIKQKSEYCSYKPQTYYVITKNCREKQIIANNPYEAMKIAEKKYKNYIQILEKKKIK